MCIGPIDVEPNTPYTISSQFNIMATLRQAIMAVERIGCLTLLFLTLTSIAHSIDVCGRLCAELPQYSKSQCERGCRLFNIGLNTNWSVDKSLDLNSTRDQCFQSCTEAYPESSKLNCFTGCSEMLNMQKEAWFYIEQRGESDGVLEVEVSLMSDPIFWEQNLGLNGGYRMPQTLIRTMPIDPEIPDQIENTPCSPPDDDLPRWFIAAIAILLTLFTLYISFALPSRDNSIFDDLDIESRQRMVENELFIESLRASPEITYLTKKMESEDVIVDLLTLDEFLTENYHINVVPPPKYTLLPPADSEA